MCKQFQTLLYYLSLASTVNGLLACCLPAAATLRRNDRLRRIGIGAALATAVAGAVAVWPPGRWTDGVAVLAVVTGFPALGAGLCLFGADRRRVFAAVGVLVFLSMPVFGERFVAP